MKKIKFLLVTVFLLLVVNYFISTVKAQAATVVPTTATLEQQGQNWQCLKGTNSKYNLTWHDPPTPPELYQDVTGDGFTPGQIVYVVACAATKDGTVCTTGDAVQDDVIFKTNNQSKVPVIIQAGPRKVADQSGSIQASAVITSTRASTATIAFYGVTFIDQTQLGSGGTEGGLQQAVNIDFLGDLSNCVNISWKHHDPYGIIFDSQSLEPLSGVTVTILDKDKNPLNLIGLTNPQTTKEDGLFNFMVEPGIYYLEPTVPTKYKFTASPNLHANYTKIYYKADGTNSIYKPNEAIKEVIDTPEEQAKNMPNPERRDIPLDPGTNAPTKTNPTIMTYGERRAAGSTVIEGKVSHPFTLLTVSQNGTKIVSKKTDRLGFYQIIIDNKNISPSSEIKVSLTKTDLTGSLSKRLIDNLLSVFKNVTNFFKPGPVAAQTVTTSINLNPIPAYLEGYAYDQKGTPLPKAIVKIMLQMTKKEYYQTQADEKGHFIINPNNLPLFDYYLEISTPNRSTIVTYTTTEFNKINNQYLKDNKINVMTAEKNGQPIITTKTSTESGTGFKKDQIQATKVTDTKKTEEKAKVNQNQSILILIGVIILFAIGAVVAWFFLFKKKPESNPPFPTQ